MTDPNTTPNRIFKIGAVTLAADETTAHLDHDGLRAALKRAYPEVAHATIHEQTLADGTTVVYFQPVAGTKG